MLLCYCTSHTIGNILPSPPLFTDLQDWQIAKFCWITRKFTCEQMSIRSSTDIPKLTFLMTEARCEHSPLKVKGHSMNPLCHLDLLLLFSGKLVLSDFSSWHMILQCFASVYVHVRFYHIMHYNVKWLMQCDAKHQRFRLCSLPKSSQSNEQDMKENTQNAPGSVLHMIKLSSWSLRIGGVWIDSLV